MLAQKNLSYASIYSPVDGVVLLRNVKVWDQTVAATSFNTPTLFIIAKDITKEMQVRAAVDEADIGDVTEAVRRVIFTCGYAYPDITFTPVK